MAILSYSLFVALDFKRQLLHVHQHNNLEQMRPELSINHV